MTAEEARKKAEENLPKKLEKDAKDQDVVIKQIYAIIEAAADNGLMFFISDLIKAKHYEALNEKLVKDGYQVSLDSSVEEKIKVKISWEND